MIARRLSHLLLASVVAFSGVAATDTPAHAVEPAFAGPRPASNVTRIVMLGDSLAHEVSGVVAFLGSPRRMVPKFWGGTAPCDWLTTDLAANRSSVVVVSFTGNYGTPCMRDSAGVPLRGPALVERYRADVTELVRRARASGARVLLVGQPLRAPSFEADVEVEGINALYRELAAHRYVSYVDAGAFVELDGRYTPRLPCAPFDPTCDPDGSIVVRGDGVHFCPVEGPSWACPVWSSGAVRFGMVITYAAMRPAAFE